MNTDSPPTKLVSGTANSADFSPFKKASARIRLNNIKPWTWFLIDFAVSYACGVLAYVITPWTVFVNSSLIEGIHASQQAFSFALALSVATLAHIAGLHEIGQRTRSFKLFGYCLLVAVIAVIVVNVELLLLHYLNVGRFITVSSAVLCTLALFAARGILISLTISKDHVVAFVGSSDFTRRAMASNQADPSYGLKTCSLELDREPGINISQWALENNVDEIVVALDDSCALSQGELLEAINEQLAVSTYSSFNEQLFERVPSEHINAQWIIDCQTDRALIYKRAVKRLLDIAGALAALVVLSPLMFLAAIAIKLDSRGPMLYRQTRLGQFGKPFIMLKLRTMIEDAEHNGMQWASKNDPRITRVGKILRATRLDETPQLINVLIGSMSLVGPRPERPEFSKLLQNKMPFFVHRLIVKPGITGWAQINSSYASDDVEHADKLAFDLYYVKTVSFGLDLRILLRTFSRFATGSR